MEFPSAQSLQAELHRPSGAKERRHQDDKSLRNPYGVGRILASAYRTPPVRGEDRVHLRHLKNQCFKRISFLPAAADLGHDL